jgi:hypothetical protein
MVDLSLPVRTQVGHERPVFADLGQPRRGQPVRPSAIGSGMQLRGVSSQASPNIRPLVAGALLLELSRSASTRAS